MEGMIYKAICMTMEECGAVAKGQFNAYDKYPFRGIDAVMNALNPAMRKAHIFIVPEVLEHHQEERQSQKGGMLIYTTVKVKYTFFAEDGSSVEAVVIGEAMDRSDKSTNKAMSAAFKYACFQTFCIPTEDFADTEAESPDPAPRGGRKKQAPPQQTKQQQAPQESEIPGYPPLPQMVADLEAVMQQDAKLAEFANQAMTAVGARSMAELAFVKKELIASWWNTKCRKQ